MLVNPTISGSAQSDAAKKNNEDILAKIETQEKKLKAAKTAGDSTKYQEARSKIASYTLDLKDTNNKNGIDDEQAYKKAMTILKDNPESTDTVNTNLDKIMKSNSAKLTEAEKSIKTIDRLVKSDGNKNESKVPAGNFEAYTLAQNELKNTVKAIQDADNNNEINHEDFSNYKKDFARYKAILKESKVERTKIKASSPEPTTNPSPSENTAGAAKNQTPKKKESEKTTKSPAQGTSPSASEATSSTNQSAGSDSSQPSSKPNDTKPSTKSQNVGISAIADKLNDDTDGQVYVLGRFEKAFGADGANQYRKAVNAMLASDPSNIKIVDNKAGGNFSVKVKDSEGKWTGATEVVTASLSKHVDFTGVDPTAKQETLVKLGTDGSALERHILARYEKAYGSADGLTRMYAATDAALATDPSNVKEFGTRGQAGYFVAVKDSKGNWSSRGENVIAVLSKYDGGAASTSEQKTTLLNASGSGRGTTIVQDFNAIYGDPETAQRAFYASIDALAKAKPGTVREFGTRGTSGFYVEVKTKDGWVGNTDKVTDVLAKYAPSKRKLPKMPPTSTTTGTTPSTESSSSQPAANQADKHDPDKDLITNKYDIWNNKSGVPESINSKAELTNARDDLTKKLEAARAANTGSLTDDIVALEGNLAEVNNRLEILEASLPDKDNDKIADKYDIWDKTAGVPKSVNTLGELNAKKEQLTAKIAEATSQNKNWLQDDIAGLQANLDEVNSKIAAKTTFQGLEGSANVGTAAPAVGQLPAAAPAPAANPAPASNNQPAPSAESHDPDNDLITNKYDVWNNKSGVPENINKKAELNNAKDDLNRQIAAARAANNPNLSDDIVALEGNLAEVNNRLEIIEASVPDTDSDKIADNYDVWDKTAGVPESVNTMNELTTKRDQLKAKIDTATAQGKNWLQDDIAGLQANLNEVNVRISHKTMPSGICLLYTSEAETV